MIHRLSLRENKTVVFLAALLVLLVSAAIGQAGWTDGLSILFLVGLGSVVVGLLITQSLLPDFIGHVFSAIIGLGWTFWMVSRLLPEGTSALVRWEVLRGRVVNWYQLAQQGGVIYDNLIFVLQMSLIIWLLGYLSIWFLFRTGKVWGAIVPSGIVLLINLHYAPNDLTSWFISFLLLSLLLLVRFNLFEYEQRWRLENIHFRSDISFDFLRNGLVFSVVVIALAWFTPAVSDDGTTSFFNRFDRQWRTVQTEWNRVFAGLNYKPQTSSNPNAYAQTHALGGSRQLSEQLVMYVQANGGRYWRAAVYDSYDGNTWQSSDQDQVRFSDSSTGASLPVYQATEAVTQTYTTLQEGLFILYAMSNPVSINRPTVAKTNLLDSNQISSVPNQPWSGKVQPWGEELTYIESDARLQSAETYQVISMKSIATKDQLRNDTMEYPQWIRDRYLSLPETTTQRVLDLAQQITANDANAFDRAEAIERYMRNQITYNELIDAPPRGRDKVDYILFEAKEAYCDYYATSMITMLRSLGVPARFAAGYAQGRAETLEGEGFQQEVFEVRNLDAHSWVEVYFPSYGWIEFEPTAAQPVIVRRSDINVPITNPGMPDGLLEDDPFNLLDDIIDDTTPQLGEFPSVAENNYTISFPFLGTIEASRGVVNWSLAGLVILAIGFVGYRATRTQNYSTSTDSVAGDVYSTMLKLANWMGLGREPSQTAHEHAAVLAETLPPVEQEINLITDEFVHQEFSRNRGDASSKTRIWVAWEKMRPKLYRAIFDQRMPKIRLPFKW